MSTVAITASDVNKLRQQTGAGMMDCKNALVEASRARRALRHHLWSLVSGKVERLVQSSCNCLIVPTFLPF